MRSRHALLMGLVLAMTALVLVAPTAAAMNGVDDLRGRWDVAAQLPGGSEVALHLYVYDLVPKAGTDDTYVAGGCMTTQASGATAPLSLQTVDNSDGTYDLTVFSSVVPPPDAGEPFVIRFNGEVEVFGGGVADDVAAGTLLTDFGDGEWSGVHHDRRRPHCPDVQPDGLTYEADMNSVHDADPEVGDTLFSGGGNIVSSGMRVQLPDGSTVDVLPFTDIFSPTVDFVSEFRFLTGVPGLPEVGQPYVFVLLDVAGDPIPGTEVTDFWFACTPGAPTGLNASQVDPAGDVDLTWNAVSSARGFDPPSGVGFYQIEMYHEDGEFVYGANLLLTPSHVIPWAPFEPGSESNPNDFGSSMSELDEGTYTIDVISFAESDPDNPGHGLECQIRDGSESLTMVKSGNSLTFP